MPVFALALVTCARREQEALIGVGYRSTATEVVRLVEQELTARGARIRVVTEVSPEIRGPTGFLAAEVDYAARLASLPGVLGVVGHQGSREALLVAPIYNEAGIAQVVPTATSRRLHQAGAFTQMLAPDDSIEGEFIGRYAAQFGARRAMLFYVLDEYGSGLRDGVQAELIRRGVDVLDAIPVDGAGGCPPDAADDVYAATVDAALLRGRPDVIILATRQLEAGCIIARAGRALPGVRFIAGDGVTINPEFLRRAGRSGDSVYLAAFWHPDKPDSISRDFVARFRAQAGREPNAGEAMFYDALKVLVAAVEHDRSRQGVARYLRRLGRDLPPVAGVTGPIAFPGLAGKLVMTRLRAGVPVLVAP